MRSAEEATVAVASESLQRDTGERPRSRLFDAVLYFASFGGGLAWTSYLLARSPGTPNQDEIAHVLISRQAWHDPHVILDAWGRPVNTLLYVIPSRFGLTGARIGALVFAAITVIFATLIARSLGVERLFLIPLFLWFQPWFHEFGYIAMTEIPFSMVLTIAIYAWLKDRPVIAALAFGSLPLIRWEALGLLPIGALILIVTRRWRILPFLGLPLVIFLGLSAAFGGDNITMREYLRMTPGAYGYGTWGHFFGTSAPLIGLPVLIAAFVGLPSAIRNRRTLGVLIVSFAYFALQVVSWRLGKGAGYAEFAMPIAPIVAIVAALGVGWVISGFRILGGRRFVQLATGFLLAGLAASVLIVGLRSEPRPLDLEATAMKEAAAWLQERDVDPQRILSTHAWFQYFYDLPFPHRHTGLIDGGRTLPGGTIMVWDNHYSNRWGYHMDDLVDPANGWERLETFRGRAAIFVKR
ncbi:MAG: hypothetical protein ACRDJ1_07335 [Actinomycetota bacterium]